MYSSHINFIFVSACYMLLVTDKCKYDSTASTLQKRQLNTSYNQLIPHFHKLICTEDTQVQDLHLKNQLSRSYNKLKLILDIQSYKKIIIFFLFNKSYKRLDHSKVLVQLGPMSINDDLVEYNTKESVYISCNIVFSYFVYTCIENVLFPCLLYFLIYCAELYVLLLQNNDTSSLFYKFVHISFFNHNAHTDINIMKYLCRERNIMCIINCVPTCNCVYVFLCLYVYVYVLCYATFVFQGLHVVLFINKVTCPIYIYNITLTFGSIYKDIIYINIVTVNGCLNVNENFIKMICNKKLNLREYKKTI